MTSPITPRGSQNPTPFPDDNKLVEFLAVLNVSSSPTANTPFTRHAFEAAILQKLLPMTMKASGLQQVLPAYKRASPEVQLQFMQAIFQRIEPSQEPQYFEYVAWLKQQVTARNT